jgi:hypothetical protein
MAISSNPYTLMTLKSPKQIINRLLPPRLSHPSFCTPPPGEWQSTGMPIEPGAYLETLCFAKNDKIKHIPKIWSLLKKSGKYKAGVNYEQHIHWIGLRKMLQETSIFEFDWFL